MDEIKDTLKMVIMIEAIESTLAQNDPQYQMLHLMNGISRIMATSMVVNSFTNQMIALQVNRIYEKTLLCEKLAKELYDYVTG